MNTGPRRPPSEVSRMRTGTERLMEPNEASVVEPSPPPNKASAAEPLRPRRPKEASAEPSPPPNKASAAEPLRLRRPKEASAGPSPPPNKASAAKPRRHEASTEPLRLPWGMVPSAK